ncbi:hypothetical protein QBC38DRAFT_518457 [Podospora fimiseda]|uniref:Transcription factor RfeG n=1 Tax=Podospora fimiseda TaxID=252190 RepID=A0AAN7BUZ6_9PEZI|nr:hypothetical protein QBC38DRAFT_518457 [Podospora fimiseda]
MAGRPNRPNQGQNVPPAPQRQNEYFVPRDGIDREVITSDICRYLGNDALVRPGTYESPDGRVTQGYFITAYRNLTSAMIQDLKADSARWEQERRASSRNAAPGAGGTMHSSHSNGGYVRKSNSPSGSREQPRGGPSDYSSWKNRQREQQDYEPAYHAPPSGAMDIDYNPAPPQSGNTHYNPGQGYQGVPPPGYAQAPYPPQVHTTGPQYQPAQGYGYAPNPPPNQQYSPGPQPGDRFGMAPPSVAPPFAAHPQDAAYVHGSNYSSAPGYATAGQPRMPPLPMTSVSAPPRASFAPSGAPYGGPEGDYGYVPPAGNPTQAFPSDPLYGRGAYATTTTITNPPEASSDDLGSPAGTTPRQGFGALPEPPFDGHSSPVPTSAGSVPPTAAPVPSTTGSATGRRDRDSEPRDHRQPRRDQDRGDDRHRNRHRHQN